jgi:hypothetical protein
MHHAHTHRSPDSPIKLIDFSLASFFETCTEPGGTPGMNPNAILIVVKAIAAVVITHTHTHVLIKFTFVVHHTHSVRILAT